MDQESDRKHCQGKVTNEEKYDSVFKGLCIYY